VTRERLIEHLPVLELEQFDGSVGIMVDLDGTSFSHYSTSFRAIQEQLGVELTLSEIADWGIQEHPKIVAVPGGPEFVRQLYEDPEWGVQVYEEAKPYPGAVEVLNRWHDQGYRLFFATSRLTTFTAVTYQSLQANDLGWAIKEGRIFLRPEGEDGFTFKNRLAGKLGVHIIIDDHPELVQHLVAPTLMVKIMPSRPWTEAHKGVPQTVMARDWKHMDELVTGFAGEISCWLSFLARLQGES
jgi:phosphoglycolate phosphatase-like HAD superfamily hydrolase